MLVPTVVVVERHHFFLCIYVILVGRVRFTKAPRRFLCGGRQQPCKGQQPKNHPYAQRVCAYPLKSCLRCALLLRRLDKY